MKASHYIPGLSVTDDQLTLSTANWYQRIDGLDTGLHGFAHRHTWDDTRGLGTDTEALVGLDFTLTINGITEGIDDTAEQLFTDWDVDDGTGTLDDVTFLDQLVVTEDDNTDVVGFQVKSHTLKSAGKRYYASGVR